MAWASDFPPASGADVVDLVEDMHFNLESGSSAGALNSLQSGFMRVEHDTAQP
jgi:hypothetical protein